MKYAPVGRTSLGLPAALMKSIVLPHNLIGNIIFRWHRVIHMIAMPQLATVKYRI